MNTRVVVFATTACLLIAGVALASQDRLPGAPISDQELDGIYASGWFGDKCYVGGACEASAGEGGLGCGAVRFTPDPTDPASAQECFNGVVVVNGSLCGHCTGAADGGCTWCATPFQGCGACTTTANLLCCTRKVCELIVAQTSTCGCTALAAAASNTRTTCP